MTQPDIVEIKSPRKHKATQSKAVKAASVVVARLKRENEEIVLCESLDYRIAYRLIEMWFEHGR